MKIAILGYSGSGKSTLAGQLAERYRIPVLYLDTVHFLPNWVERDFEEELSIVRSFLQNNPSWVIDGNYRKFLRQERLEQADQILLFTFPRRICLYRILRRYLQNRNHVRESMAAGCIEKIDADFIWWILHKGRTKAIREDYRETAARYREKLILLKTPAQVNAYIQSVLSGCDARSGSSEPNE